MRLIARISSACLVVAGLIAVPGSLLLLGTLDAGVPPESRRFLLAAAAAGLVMVAIGSGLWILIDAEARLRKLLPGPPEDERRAELSDAPPAQAFRSGAWALLVLAWTLGVMALISAFWRA